MKLKLFLLLAPLLVALVLLQSYFWVPTYEKQTRGNPERLEKFIHASIGDAKILNPILNADASSSDIAGQVFDGLLDLEADWSLRPRLATHWEITETAYLQFQAQPQWPDASSLLKQVQALIEHTPALKSNVLDVQILPAHTEHETFNIDSQDSPLKVEVQLPLPQRLEFHLKEVDQDFFMHFKPLLGDSYEQQQPWLEQWTAPENLNPEQEQQLRQQLAEKYPVFEHNPILLFTLREGVLFHDGHEFDAGDVKFTYEALMDAKNLSPRTSDFEPIKSLEILDRFHLRIIYKRLFSPAINAWMIGILPEHLLNAQAMQAEMAEKHLSDAARDSYGMRDSRFNRAPIGTGPFRFVTWESDELIHLTRNEDYWDGAPLYKDYFYRIVPDRMTQEIEFRTGAIDSYAPEPYQVARYQKDDRYRIFASLGSSYVYIGYNNRRTLLADKQVRRALGMALDADEILRYVLYGQAERITGPYPKQTQWYNEAVKPLPYDPQMAVQLLNQLGWQKNADGWLEKDGKEFEFNLITNNGNSIRKAIMTIAQDNWRKIGIKCHTQVFEWAVFLQDFITPGQFDAVVLGWSMGIDPDLYQIWHSSQAGPHQLNFVGYESPQADELIVRIRREYNQKHQIELTRQLHQIIADDQPYTFIYAPRVTRIFDKKIVMLGDNGEFEPIRTTANGSWMFYFNRWKKLEHSLE